MSCASEIVTPPHTASILFRWPTDGQHVKARSYSETIWKPALVKAGVIDPAKVTRLALQNAASIAGLMLTTEAMVADIKEEGQKAAAGAGQGGGMGGMY